MVLPSSSHSSSSFALLKTLYFSSHVQWSLKSLPNSQRSGRRMQSCYQALLLNNAASMGSESLLSY